ncbi:type II restriction endonuclease [Lentisphaera profundi]|uniref:Type II restriction endonuclease n=1 Tax=Lentisphaera profundi TaxID=1658616 RepID=A0ABY7VV00_9BACT|nr:type II restriction endonuclease [Lentisphaera profundi]WDE97537.1 type II restriction endonuclease [Lentisphaera profundi]
MEFSNINQYFDGVAAKYLSAVDAEHHRSNQHEIGGLVKVGFKQHLGSPGKGDGQEIRYACKMVYVTDDLESPEICEDTVTWYDSRRLKTNRGPEYRLYYKDNEVTNSISEGDFFLIAKQTSGELLIIFTKANSAIEFQLCNLFSIENVTEKFSKAKLTQKNLLLPIRLMLEGIGIVLPYEEDQNLLDELLTLFPEKFPTTAIFSQLTRDKYAFSPLEAPDDTIVGWMEKEEFLFRTYEREVVSKKLRQGFGENGCDVDEFVSYSLSVQNRRKSRVGHAFENHLNHLFKIHSLKFENGSRKLVTENKAKPDYLFPSFEAYHDPQFPVEQLRLLGAKTSCKDRWRQVLAEGDRICHKHLITLQAGISVTQTDEMKNKKLTLVVPRSIHSTYLTEQQTHLLTVANFISDVKEIQKT